MNLTAKTLLFTVLTTSLASAEMVGVDVDIHEDVLGGKSWGLSGPCLLYTSPSPRDRG